MENNKINNSFYNNFDESLFINVSLVDKKSYRNVKTFLYDKITEKVSKFFINCYKFKNPEDIQSENKITSKILYKKLANKNIKSLIEILNTNEEKILEKLGFSSKIDLMKQRDTSYVRVTRNLNENEIDLEISYLPKNYDLTVLHLLKKEKRCWQTLSTHNMKQFAYQALDLFKRDKITYSEFSTCMIFWSISHDYPISKIAKIPLFKKDGDINPIAYYLINKTLESENKSWLGVIDKDKLNKIFTRMKDKPNCEKYIFCIENESIESLKSNLPPGITETLFTLGFNFLNFSQLPKEMKLSDQQELRSQEYVNNLDKAKLKIDSKILKLQKLKNKIDELSHAITSKSEFLIHLEESKPKLKEYEELYGKLFNEKYPEEGFVIRSTYGGGLSIGPESQEIPEMMEEIIELKLLKEQLQDDSTLQARKAICWRNFMKLELQRWEHFLYVSNIVDENSVLEEQNISVSTPVRLRPTFGLMQEFINEIGQEPITFAPVIDLSTLDDIENNGVNSTRDFALSFPNIELPETADYLRAPLDHDFNFHDLFHGAVASLVKQKVRENCIALARDLKNICVKEENSSLLQATIDALIDMEMVAYLPINSPHFENKDEEALVLFINHLNNIMINAVTKSSIDDPILNFLTIRNDTQIREQFLLEFAELLIEKGILPDDLSDQAKIYLNELSVKYKNLNIDYFFSAYLKCIKSKK